MASFTTAEGKSGSPTDDGYRAELAAVLASDMFRRSPKLSRLLSHLCEEYFQGRGAEITEYSIALDVLGRDARFDPQQDSVVRVDAHLLRKRLKQYYAGIGTDRDIQILIPTGQYTPKFVHCAEPAPSEPKATDAAPSSNTQAAALQTLASKPERLHIMNRPWAWVMAALALVALTGGLFASGALWKTPKRSESANYGSPAGLVTAPVPVAMDEMRIAAGESNRDYTDSVGRTWLSDRYFHGGTTFHRGANPIQRTQDPELFQRGREGQFVYDIPLHPGVWELHLYFAETAVTSEALRSVSIAINGLPVSNIDIVSDAGGANIATAKIYKDLSPAKDGLLHIMFQGAAPGFLNALEILPGTPGKMLPVRLSTKDSIYRDRFGQVWLPDHGALGGRKSARIVPIGDTSDPGLYQWERFGHYNYAIPVVEGGRYTVTLHFSETWFGSPLATGGVGSRVFDVYSDGLTLLKNFDILKEAGGAGSRAVIKVFHNVPASPLGKLDLAFVPIANYALVNALQVIQE